MWPNMKQKISLGLTILPIILLIACSKEPTPQSITCPVAVHASPQVKTWLKGANPPDYVVHYFKLIADEQEAIEAVCP